MNDTITINREEYKALIAAKEDLEDIRAVEEYRANPSSGLPSEFVRRMIDGENLIKLWREHRGLSGAELAKLAGLKHRVQLHDIETGKSKGSVETLRKLAEVLGVKIDDLV